MALRTTHWEWAVLSAPQHAVVFDMVEAKLAAVRPRVRVSDGAAVRLLEEEIRGFIEEKGKGVIALLGPAGSGKSTALADLAAVLQPCPVLSAAGTALVALSAGTARPGSRADCRDVA